MELEIKKNMFGGKGEVHFKHLLTEEEKNGMLRVYAEVTVQPHSEVGFHTHNGDGESYYVLSGEGVYNDGEKTYTVKKGDHMFAKDGTSHGLVNDNDEPLVVMALIIYTQKH
jgi:quercetin dioxygenase-like cupin family protein